jgi:transmembrane protein 231
VWNADRGAGQPFVARVTVRYAPQMFWYRPGFWQEIKYGWIQYLAILVPFYYLLASFRSFAFNNGVLISVIRPPLNAKAA